MEENIDEMEENTEENEEKEEDIEEMEENIYEKEGNIDEMEENIEMMKEIAKQIEIIEEMIDQDQPDSARQFSSYRDTQYRGTEVEQDERLLTSQTLYVGNLSYYTTEEQVYEIFSLCGDVKNVIMGLDRYQNTPCGFCFVEYNERSDAEDCVRYMNGTKVDERVIRVDWDSGFVEGRQFGRGMTGGQVRDEHRTVYDAERGGFGKLVPSQNE